MKAYLGFSIRLQHRGIDITGMFDAERLIWYASLPEGGIIKASTAQMVRTVIDGCYPPTQVENSRNSSKILDL